MATNKAIFGLRFGSNTELNPTPEDLRVFLDSTATTGAREPHGRDLARYRGLLEDLRLFEQYGHPDLTPQGTREKMFFGALGHSQFFNPGLALAVEQFKYHLHALASLDPVKPAAFIRTAEAEIGRLSPKKRKDDAARLARLQSMVEDRKKALALLKSRRLALVKELGNIARYVRDNLVRIEKRCEAAIVILVELQISRREEKQVIDGIKDRFRGQVKDSLHRGQISRQDLDAVKKDVGVISQEVSSLIKEDVYAMTGLFESVHDHVKEHVRGIDRLMTELGSGRDRSIADDQELFTKIERVLVSLVSAHRFELGKATLQSETAHEQVLREARRDMLHRIFTLLERERRTRSDRRSGGDRRRYREPHLTSSEQRTGQDRRSGKSRRRPEGLV